ncbi:MAG TPA: alpha/beta hydrolase [Frankiaceae bacterium]|nr:alpha/beta hydrolase [Frankiaceae bacterium]
MKDHLTAPRLEGTFAVGDRRLGFAEFGNPRGRAVLWIHGTPGARRQVPEPARVAAQRMDLRIVGIDRPGVGASTPHRYTSIRDFSSDVEPLLDALGIDTFVMIGLSGGGPYVLGCAHAMPDRMMAAGLIGSVAPTVGADAPGGGLVDLTRRLHPFITSMRAPLSVALSALAWSGRPIAGNALELYARLSPEGDRRMLGRPEFRAMFLDDLLNGSRMGLRAPIDDLILFGQDWGFPLSEVRVPVHAWHGERDHIVPFAHGVHLVSRLPEAHLYPMPGESHLGGLGEAVSILRTLDKAWDSRLRKPVAARS